MYAIRDRWIDLPLKGKVIICSLAAAITAIACYLLLDGGRQLANYRTAEAASSTQKTTSAAMVAPTSTSSDLDEGEPSTHEEGGYTVFGPYSGITREGEELWTNADCTLNDCSYLRVLATSDNPAVIVGPDRKVLGIVSRNSPYDSPGFTLVICRYTTPASEHEAMLHWHGAARLALRVRGP